MHPIKIGLSGKGAAKKFQKTKKGIRILQLQINNLRWEIEFLPGEDEKLKSDTDNVDLLGLTVFKEQKIYIQKGLSEGLTLSTVIHELSHAWIFSYGIHLDGEESICDFMGAFCGTISYYAEEVCKHR